VRFFGGGGLDVRHLDSVEPPGANFVAFGSPYASKARFRAASTVDPLADRICVSESFLSSPSSNFASIAGRISILAARARVIGVYRRSEDADIVSRAPERALGRVARGPRRGRRDRIWCSRSIPLPSDETVRALRPVLCVYLLRSRHLPWRIVGIVH